MEVRVLVGEVDAARGPEFVASAETMAAELVMLSVGWLQKGFCKGVVR